MNTWPDNVPSKADQAVKTWEQENPDARVAPGAFLMPISVGFAEWMEDERRGSRDGDRWGPWVYAENRTLTHSAVRYEIDLDRIQTARDAVDWIDHLGEKAWMTPEDMGHLVRALIRCAHLNALAHSPPARVAAKGGPGRKNRNLP